MPNSLTTLEQRRSEILQQISRLGDLRSGSITSISGPCGKSNCHCHQPGHPGHGPNFRLTRKFKGKTVTETFATPAALQKAQYEVAAYHRFRELSGELLEVNEKICERRPVAEAGTAQEKKRLKRSSTRSSKK